MKKIISLLTILLLLNSCGCNNYDLIVYNFSEEEKEYVPYELNENILFKNDLNQDIHGFIINKSLETLIDQRDGNCIEIHSESISCKLNLSNQESFFIRLEKKDLPVPLSVSYYRNEIKEDFLSEAHSFEGLIFDTISLNNMVFQNSVLLVNKGINGEVLNKLVYSKTHGIEFILFEDGSWYKRVE